MPGIALTLPNPISPLTDIPLKPPPRSAPPQASTMTRTKPKPSKKEAVKAPRKSSGKKSKPLVEGIKKKRRWRPGESLAAAIVACANQ